MLEAAAWMATFRSRQPADQRTAPSMTTVFSVRPANVHVSAPSPAENPTRNPHTNYPRLSRLKPNDDGMQAITQCRSPRGRPGPGSGAALPGRMLSGFPRNALMATDDTDPEGIRDIVAGRLRVMIGA